MENFVFRTKLEESKEIRKYRKRHGGINAEDLLVGKSKDKSENNDVINIFLTFVRMKLNFIKFFLQDDPYKTKSGGMVDVNALKNAPKMDDAYDTGIGTSFSAETNRRDEDAEMQVMYVYVYG